MMMMMTAMTQRAGGASVRGLARTGARAALSTHVEALRDKVVSVKDAASLVRDGDTVFVSGFVTQGVADTVLRGLETRFLEEQHPRDLTLMFYGCGDPAGKRGTNRFRHPGMLKRIVASHYGQSPDLQPLIFANEVQAYSLPMGSIARMVRAKASGSPGHFTKVGLGTFVDPRHGGGRVNEATSSDIVQLMEIDGQEFLRFRPLHINVAIIRATTADPSGNLTIEHESVCPDINMVATSARASGGIVIAQVDRIAARNSLKMRDIRVPGPLVDCVVVADPEDVGMSFYTKYDPSWSGELRKNLNSVQPLPMSVRKIIARRAAMELEPDNIVNLGIGMPEGVASVAAEENVLEHITLTTEAGMIGGIGASGMDFGPATNANAMVEIGHQFDFYNGSGLDVCFLGAAEADRKGNINVSRISDKKLTGPGGFVDISQCTQRVVFVGTFRKKGLRVSVGGTKEAPKLQIDQEGELPMFTDAVREVTFNGDMALHHAQDVTYITERAVFKLSPEGMELVEVAPGIDVDRDVLALMGFEPKVDRDNLKIMDPRIFGEGPMRYQDDFFQDFAKFSHRFHLDKSSNTLYVDMSGIVVQDEETLDRMLEAVRKELELITDGGANKVHCMATYDRADISENVSGKLIQALAVIEEKYYLSVRRMAGKLFVREKVSQSMDMLDNSDLWESFLEQAKGESALSRREFRMAVEAFYQVQLSNADLLRILGDRRTVERSDFDEVISKANTCIVENLHCH